MQNAAGQQQQLAVTPQPNKQFYRHSQLLPGSPFRLNSSIEGRMAPNFGMFASHHHQPQKVRPYDSKCHEQNAFGTLISRSSMQQSGSRECGRLLRRRTVFYLVFMYMLACILVTLKYQKMLYFSNQRHFGATLNDSTIYEGYCIHPNVFKPSLTEEPDEITQVLHVSANFLDGRLVEQVNNWQAPVSLSVVLMHRGDYDCVMKKMGELLKGHPEVGRHLRLHLLFPSDWDSDCRSPIEQSACSKSEYTDEDMVNYPANVARNTARMFAATKYVLIADFEHMFSAGFAQDVRKVAESWLTGQNSRRVLVYRIFEVDEKAAGPKTVAELEKLYKKGKAVVFHSKFYKGAHDIPKLKEWFRENASDTGIFMEDVGYNRSNWEPQFVSTNDVPFHDVNFPFLIRDNTVLRWELCRAGYKFDILSRHFMYHKGIKTSRGIPWKSVVQNKKRFKHALDSFRKRMKESYPETEADCPKPSA